MVVATDTSVPSDSYSSFQWQRIEEMDCKLFQRLLHLSGFSKFQTQTPCLLTRVKTVLFSISAHIERVPIIVRSSIQEFMLVCIIILINFLIRPTSLIARTNCALYSYCIHACSCIGDQPYSVHCLWRN